MSVSDAFVPSKVGRKVAPKSIPDFRAHGRPSNRRCVGLRSRVVIVGFEGAGPLRPGRGRAEGVIDEELHAAMIDHTTNPDALEPFDLEVAPRVRGLPPYLFGKINELKYRKRVAGIDVIDLGMGNPTDPPEQWVIDKLCEAAQDDRNHRYSVATGVYNLRKEVADRYATPVRRHPRPRARGRRHDRLEGGVQPHVPGPPRSRRHRPGAGPKLPDPRPRHRPGLGQRDRPRRPRPPGVPGQHRPGLREPDFPKPKILVLNYPHNPTARPSSTSTSSPKS